MRLDRLDAQFEGAGDIRRFVSPANQAEDLQFPIAENLGRRVRGPMIDMPTSDRPGEQSGRQLVVQGQFALQHGPQCLDNCRRAVAFRAEAPGTRSEGALDVMSIFEHRVDED
ncbi:MAG: hypothetical protein ACK559_02520, partial [bacterium]